MLIYLFIVIWTIYGEYWDQFRQGTARQTLGGSSTQSLHGGDNTTNVNKQHTCNTISCMCRFNYLIYWHVSWYTL